MLDSIRIPQGSTLQVTPEGLAMEGVLLADLARQHGTPLFAYSQAAMAEALAAYQRGLQGRRAQVFYAMKANSNLAILQWFVRAGCGLDIVSGGELARALAAGCSPQRIIFSGVGKTRQEMREALKVGIACFNVESLAELDTLNEVAVSLGVQAAISLRVNPDVDAQTHPYISTGLKDNKFGIAHEDALSAYQRAQALPGLVVHGIDCHIGSQITQIAPYLDAMDKMLDLVQAVEASGIPLQHIDFGGGLGIDYNGDTPPQADALWTQLLARIDARGLGDKALFIEPGRSLIGNAGVCLTEVQYLKPGEHKNFCIVDAAMNDLPRPALYQAFHGILPTQARATPAQTWTIVGPVCESGDWIGRDRELAVAAGDVLAVASAGAYCMSMASNYNTRNRAKEVLIDGVQVHVIRERESYADQWALERPLPQA
jgi:diaminopimelate decarboxylase